MDNTCTLRSLTAFQIGPCSYFLRSGGEVGFEIEQAVSRSDQTGNARFFQAYFLKEHLSFLVSFELGDFRFCFSCQDKDFGILVFNGFAYHIHVFVTRYGAVVVHVADIHYRFVGKQEKVMGYFLFVFGLESDGTSSFPLFECFFVSA